MKESARNPARWEDLGPDDIVDDVVAAQLLNLSPRTLRAWRIAAPVSRGPAFRRLGSSIRYVVRDLRTFVDRAKVITADDPAPSPQTLRRIG